MERARCIPFSSTDGMWVVALLDHETSAAVNICVQVVMIMSVFSCLGYLPGSGIAGAHGDSL